MRVYPKGPEGIVEVENDHALRSRSVKIESHETFFGMVLELTGKG